MYETIATNMTKKQLAAADRSATVEKLKRDLKDAATKLTKAEARFLVDYYYTIQEDRIRATNQLRAAGEDPSMLLSWLSDQSQMLEGQLKLALDRYTLAHPVGQWLRSLYGIGPVLAAGLIAHIDIHKAPAAGNIWSFAGLDPNVKWEKGKVRPYNAKLKTLCWKIGQSFMKFSGNEKCFYGHLYRERKAYELERSESGAMAEYAAEQLKRYRPETQAYGHYAAGKLPPSQIDGRARRYAVKMMLSHLHLIWYRHEFKREPPKPFAIDILKHAHLIPPPMNGVVPDEGQDDVEGTGEQEE